MVLIKKTAKALFYLLGSLLYLCSRIIPRDKNLWVFGAWFGKRYGGNSKYLFQYAQRDKDIKAVWIAKTRDVVSKVRREGGTAFLSYSPKGIFRTLRAGLAIVSSGQMDINAALTAGALKVNLWHGAPMKKLMYEDNRFKTESFAKRCFRKLLWALLPHIRETGVYDSVLATSDYFRPIMRSAFGVSMENVKILGYPRNDILFNDTQKCQYMEYLKDKFGCQKMLGYFPTYRNTSESDNSFTIMDRYGFDSDAMEAFLQQNDSIMLVKLHYVDQNRVKKLFHNPDSRIVYADENNLPELNDVLGYIDVLITDYSGVYFDYLLLNRPVIFAAFDLEKYIRDRGLYDQYEFYLSGPMAQNWKQVIDYAKEAIENPQKYEKLRIAKNEIFNRYQDDKSSMRVFEYLRTNVLKTSRLKN